MADSKAVKKDVTTPIGTLSFPHIFRETATKMKDAKNQETGELGYDIQIIIPKTEREGLRALMKAIKEVGESKWGENWKKARNPLRDGDREKDELTEDGSTKGNKYPERLGCFFLNARSTKPVGVYDRTRTPINNPNEVYGGCKGKIAVTFYAYSKQGNQGIAAGLNGVQKTGEGEPFGSGPVSVESMFDLLDDEVDADDLGLDDVAEEEEEAAPPARKAPAKRAAKKAPARRKPEPEPEDDEADLDEPDEEADEYDDL